MSNRRRKTRPIKNGRCDACNTIDPKQTYVLDTQENKIYCSTCWEQTYFSYGMPKYEHRGTPSWVSSGRKEVTLPHITCLTTPECGVDAPELAKEGDPGEGELG